MGLVVKRWQRPGQERLYVNVDGTRHSLGYYDCKTGKLELRPEYEDRQYEVMDVLRPFLGSAVPEWLRGQMIDQPPARESDLARNRPGAAVAARAAELRPGGIQGFVARLLGLRTDATSWELGAEGERVVGKRLARLERDGWKALSSIVKRSGADIDHVLIGPPGVFTVNTKHHRGARVWVGEQVVKVNGRQERYLPKSRHEADSAARMLSRVTGLTITVTPVLAFVGVKSLDISGSRGDVLVTRGEEIDHALREIPARYSYQERERIYSSARRAEIWKA